VIEALKSNEVVDKVGGRFKLAVLIQKRLVDVTFGAPLLVERREGQTLMEAVIQEVLEGKITLETDGGGRRATRATATTEEAEEKDED